ncbi:hypothetical protein [Burkholderia ubonensis]|uniref:hypothetical protein n=1 Tax=Burkholderia ubonensis TaxID=101571 RepID=UPI000AB84F47|nr:hypothetical protein [Burkholderia ubonensis]
MREHSLRTGSSFQGRGEHRPNYGKTKPATARSKRSVNLGRLGDELGGLDMLGAALGLTDEAVRILVDGRDHAREEQYVAHLVLRLKEAGIPNDWLERQYAPIAPEYLRALRTFAAASSNKAPIRRSNFRRLALAFDGRATLLADALEMVVPSIANVAEGRLEFDDGRFGHINPRLMQAGFPDGWLEQAEPDLTDAMIESVGQLATDAYERELAENEEDLKHTAGQAFVSPSPTPVAEPSVQPVAAPLDTSQETVMATASQRQAKSTKPTQPTFNTPAPQFKAAGMPTGAKPMAHPTAGGAQLSRSVLASGRKLGGAPVGKPAAAPAAAPKAAPKATPAAKKTHAAPARAATPEADERRTPAPRGTVSKEVSLARAEALEQLLENARRGVKVTLWRDILGSSLPFWGNIRRGAVLFRDELARGVEQAMGLPANWLDHPKFPPKSMAAWVNDPDAPVPTALEAQAAHAEQQHAPAPAAAAAPAPAAAAAPAAPAASTKPSVTKPYARKTAPTPPKVTMTKPPAAPPVFGGATPAAAAAPVTAAPAAAPVETAAAPVAATAPSFAVTGQISPMVSTLLSLIQAKVSAGNFTDADAMKLIHSLSA